ncbi:MAG TPA: phytoene/squalene synthase family protein [Spirochaetaceae bacterium]|jgi:phytoene synthase|nr:phytoene/squalene synthase family protein [Spirochaetaceae bacterium]
MADTLQKSVFKAGSTTYFNSSLFFSKAVMREVEVLYGFVRVADNYVDALPQDSEGFRRFEAAYRAALAGEPAGDPVIDDYVALAKKRGFEPAWTDAFLDAMRADLTKSIYQSEEELLAYVYGSAEVIGLFMARILGLPPEAEPSARLLGRAMQIINFIRDVDEDRRYGRRYLPVQGSPYPADWLPNEADAAADPEAWAAFLRAQLARYRAWQEEAVKGYRYISRRSRAAIKTAGDMYDWTGSVIEADPMVVFKGKVKPSKGRIVRGAILNYLRG